MISTQYLQIAFLNLSNIYLKNWQLLYPTQGYILKNRSNFSFFFFFWKLSPWCYLIAESVCGINFKLRIWLLFLFVTFLRSLIIALLHKGFQVSLFSGNVWKMISYNRTGNNSAILAHSSESSCIMLSEVIFQRCSYEKVLWKICSLFTGEHPWWSVID